MTATASLRWAGHAGGAVSPGMSANNPSRPRSILDIPFGGITVAIDMVAFQSPSIDALALHEGDFVAWAKAVTVDHLTLSAQDAMVLSAMVRARANARPRTPATPKRRRRRR